MTNKWLILVAAVAALLVIGCAGGGESGDDCCGATNGTTSTTNGSTNGSTTGTTSAFAGFYQGSFSGSNTTGARFTGDGGADISADGSAFFEFAAQVQGGAPYNRSFDGMIDSAGRFTGTTHTGESVRGTVSRSGNSLAATLVWDKRTVSGQIFYTETEQFNLTLQP